MFGVNCSQVQTADTVKIRTLCFFVLNAVNKAWGANGESLWVRDEVLLSLFPT